MSTRLANGMACSTPVPEAAALQQRDRWAGKTVGVAITGGNVDASAYAQVLTSAP